MSVFQVLGRMHGGRIPVNNGVGPTPDAHYFQGVKLDPNGFIYTVKPSAAEQPWHFSNGGLGFDKWGRLIMTNFENSDVHGVDQGRPWLDRFDDIVHTARLPPEYEVVHIDQGIGYGETGAFCSVIPAS